MECIHGNRSQAQRTQALGGFKSDKYDVLVATDIAARGIDVTGLGHLVNFDVPAAVDDYVHRVGRTGRAERVGTAFTFVSPEEEGTLRDIERGISRRLPRVTVPNFDYAAPPRPLEVPVPSPSLKFGGADRKRAHGRASQRRGRQVSLEAGHRRRRRGGGADAGNTGFRTRLPPR